MAYGSTFIRKSKLFLSILIFGLLLLIAIPKNSIPLDMGTEESSTTQEESVSCIPFLLSLNNPIIFYNLVIAYKLIDYISICWKKLFN